MKTNWQHQKDAITTDQKNLTDDEHVHEEDKQHLKASEKPEIPIPQKAQTGRTGSKEAD
jgi:hypothetical protein